MAAPSLHLLLGLRRGLLLPGLRGNIAWRVSAAVLQQAAGYQSPASTDALYPGTRSQDRFSTVPPPSLSPDSKGGNSKRDLFSGHIPMSALTISHVRSSGPGGQNVNKINSKVDIRFHFDSAEWLSQEVKEVVRPALERELNKEGFLVVRSDRTRSQLMNQADALRKLREAIWKALEAAPTSYEPTPEQAEFARKKALKAARIRVREKRSKSMVKSDRKRGGGEW